MQRCTYNQTTAPTVNGNNMNTAINETIEEIKSDIVSRLNDYKGNSYYGCDLAYKLFEGENADGSVLCNTYLTKEYIKDNFELFGDFLEHYESNFGSTLNPFTEPEKAHVCFLLEAAQSILASCELINDNWNEEHDTRGTIGRSTGTVKIPLLIATSRSHGGGAILDHCIVKIRGKYGIIYQAENYQQPKLEIVPSDLPNYTHNVNINGELYSRHKSERSAKLLVKKLS